MSTVIGTVIFVVAARGLYRLWRRDLLAGSFLTGLLSALAVTAGFPAVIGVPVALACFAVCYREAALIDRHDDRFAIGAHRWPLDGDR